jgi:gas vesicle protein
MRGSNGRLAFGVFMGGLGLGVLLSLLFAPQSGEETRELIAKKARRARNLVGDAVDSVGDAVDDIRWQVADTVRDAKSRVQEAVQVGKEAYQDELARKAHA